MSRWDELLRTTRGLPRTLRHVGALDGRAVLITGGGGFIGSTLAKSILAGNPRQVILLDHAEENLYRAQSDLENQFAATAFRTVLGDVADRALLQEILEKWQPDVIFHAAAFKHVPLMEENPFAVMRNNVLGTRTLAAAALDNRVPRLIMISTDKAVNPRSIMGASKRMAELVLLALNSADTQMSALRFGNVFGSNGSVVPRFRAQIASGGPVYVTHPDATRYFLTPDEAVDLILAAAALADGAGLLVPELGEPVRITELANELLREKEPLAAKLEIRFSGLRSGEKLAEDLVGVHERVEATADATLFRVRGMEIASPALQEALHRLATNIAERNLAGMLDLLCELIPEYVPSSRLLAALPQPAS